MSSDTVQADILDATKLPCHVAIIMDGNGRWAEKRLLNRVRGHEKGAETVRSIARTCRELNISVLTLYAFSTENWQRPKREIAALMNLLDKFLINEEPEMLANNIRLGVIGQPRRLPEYVQRTIQRVLDSTQSNEGMLLNLALSYGGRTEILEMVQAITRKIATGTLSPDGIDMELIEAHLYTHNLPDPDLLIRTSGEMRISNFLLWQLAYTEIFVTTTLWPDFSREEFIDILNQYQRRDRRFGKVKG